MYPIVIRRGKGDYNDFLELILYCNRIQLATADALYSDGDRYTPALAAINALKGHMHAVRTVLVLGAGLGSMVQVVRARGYRPQFTLVEQDKVVLQWAMEFLSDAGTAKTIPICGDAEVFMAGNKDKYDLIFLDVFNSRVVPAFVYSASFLSHCRNSLSPAGHLAFNYIVNEEHEWQEVKNIFAGIFPQHNTITSGINRILIGEM